MKQEAGMKRCNKCGEIKPTTEFYKAIARRDGLSHFCKECSKQANKEYRDQNLEKERDRTRRWKEENLEKCKESKARSRRKTKYGLTQEAFLQMLINQNNKCAICGLTFDGGNQKTKPHVDHDHDTGAVRSLLCKHCNTMLGNSYDNPETLRKGASYLEQHK